MSVESHLDYLTIVGARVPNSYSVLMYNQIANMVEDDHESILAHEWREFEGNRKESSAHGVRLVLGSYDVTDDTVHVTISLGGAVLARMSSRDQHGLLVNIVKSSLYRVTRIDLATDDFAKRITPKTIADLELRGWWHGSRKTRIHIGGSSDIDADTFYGGSKQSEKKIRIYNKDKESRGMIDSIRWESELHGRYSRPVADFLGSVKFTTDERWSQLVGMVNVGYFALREPTGDPNVYRRPYHPLFKSLVDDIGGVQNIQKVQVVSSLERTAVWFDRNCTKPMAKIMEGIGEVKFFEYLRTSIALAKERITRKEMGLIREWQRITDGLVVSLGNFDNYPDGPCPI